MRKLIFISATGCLIALFQNCSRADQVVFSEQPLSATSSAPDVLQNEAEIVSEANQDSSSFCFLSGYTFKTGDALPFIHYRKCDGEIESWRKIGQSQCCSGQVSIVDVESYEDDVCPRFRGIMKCL